MAFLSCTKLAECSLVPVKGCDVFPDDCLALIVNSSGKANLKRLCLPGFLIMCKAWFKGRGRP